MRVYLPADADLLARWRAAGSVSVAGDFVVAESDDEEEEYAATATAAALAADLLSAPGRRFVVVLDVDAEPAEGDELPWRRVAAVLADTDPVDASAPGDLPDLGWYGLQEIDSLIAD